jgi:hypothetical protein
MHERGETMKKLGIWGGLIGALALTLAAAAPTASAEQIEIQGRGVLGAHGTGIAALKGAGEVQLNANRGILLVKDLAGDAEVDVVGAGGSGEWNGFDVYFGTGAAHIAGSDVAVIVVGTDIDLRARGEGWAFLKGHGYFFVNGAGPFRWNPEGGFAALERTDGPSE